MERLTYHDGLKPYINKLGERIEAFSDSPVRQIINRLAAYEDTGLTPDEIKHPPMIAVEGYRAFHGTMRITPKCSVPPFEITADWLYKPDTGCWYGDGHSYPAGICEVEEDGRGIKKGE